MRVEARADVLLEAAVLSDVIIDDGGGGDEEQEGEALPGEPGPALPNQRIQCWAVGSVADPDRIRIRIHMSLGLLDPLITKQKK